MVKELGAKFGLQGVEVAIQQLGQLKGSFAGLSQAVDQHVPAASRKMDVMANSVHKMASSVRSSMNMAKLAIAGFLTGKAVQGLANWMGGDAETGQKKDYLRYHGADEKTIKAAEAKAKELSRKIPGFSKGDYFDSMFTIQSMHASQGLDQMKAVSESMSYLSKSMKGTSIDAATDYYKVMHSSFADALPKEAQAKFHERVMAGTHLALSSSKALAPDFKAAMGYLGPVYSAIGKSLEDALTDVAVLAPALGGGEKAGSALRNLTAMGGESYGKLYAAVKQQKYEQIKGKKLEFMDKEDQHAWSEAKKMFEAKQGEVGGELLQKDPEKYWANISKMIQAIKAEGGDWMGTLVKHGFERESVPAALKMAEAYKTGQRQALHKTITEAQSDVVKQTIEQESKSFASQYELFEQKMHGMSASVRKILEPFLIDIMGPWGDQVARLTDAWNANSTQIKENARQLFSAIGTGFSEAFGGLPDINAKARELIDTLASTDPEKWKLLGNAIGQDVGSAFKEVSGLLSQISSALPPILELLSSMASVAGKINAAGTALAGLREKIFGQENRTTDSFVPKQTGSLLDRPVRGPGELEPEQGRSGMEPVARPTRPSLMDQAIDQKLGQLGYSETKVNNDIKVYLDGRELAARVEEQRSSEHDRNRRGAGELGFAR